MIQVIIGATFLLMSAILYSANVISVSITRSQSDVGYSLLIISVITAIMGLMLLLMREVAIKYTEKETEPQKNPFFNSDLDN